MLVRRLILIESISGSVIVCTLPFAAAATWRRGCCLLACLEGLPEHLQGRIFYYLLYYLQLFLQAWLSHGSLYRTSHLRVPRIF